MAPNREENVRSGKPRSASTLVRVARSTLFWQAWRAALPAALVLVGSVCAAALALAQAPPVDAVVVPAADVEAGPQGAPEVFVPSLGFEAPPAAPARERWTVEALRLRATVFDQTGRGYQSAAGSIAGPGDERLLVVQPLAWISLRQNRDITHEIVGAVDIVSEASPNATDVISAASAVNEALGIDITTHAKLSPVDTLHIQEAFAADEPLITATFGLGYERSLADDNATLSVSAQAVFDRTDRDLPDGRKIGDRQRTALSANAGFSQLLSPTTVASLSYGATFQQGTLEVIWNSVPLSDRSARVGEIFPHSRLRQALALDLAQHVPGAHATLRGQYRYYWDDFELAAHTAEIQWSQEVSEQIALRGSYRFYEQTAVDFFTTSLPPDTPRFSPKTADSDLAAFRADEWGLKLSWLRNVRHSIDLSYYYYTRPSLHAHVASVGYAGSF